MTGLDEGADDPDRPDGVATGTTEPTDATATTDDNPLPPPPPAPPDAGEETFVDGTVGRSDLAAERDEYLEALQRVKAEFDNFRRRTENQRVEVVERANERLAGELLPVLDACDAAVGQGADGAEPIRAALLDALGREGLDRMEPEGKPFDPNLHEAVMHEEGAGDPVVSEVFRAGYTWKGRVLRPAMVKVKG